MGNLESEDIVLRGIGEEQDYWLRPSIVADLSPSRAQLDNDKEIVKYPVENGRAAIDAALRVQNVDIMIRDLTMPKPSTNWVSRGLYQPSQLAQADFGTETVTFFRA